jgi:hypothetical protein
MTGVPASVICACSWMATPITVRSCGFRRREMLNSLEGLPWPV